MIFLDEVTSAWADFSLFGDGRTRKRGIRAVSSSCWHYHQELSQDITEITPGFTAQHFWCLLSK